MTLGTALALIIIGLAVVIAVLMWRTFSLARQAGLAVPRAGQVQPVKGGAIHFIERGPADRPTLVLIHGLAGQLQHFTYALVGLLEDDFRVIALDRPGCGYSERDSDGLAALPEQARMIWEFLDARGVRDPILVGHSLGGAVALQMAMDRPDGTAALALLCPATRPVSKPPHVFKGLEVASPLMRRALAFTIAVPMAKASGDQVLTDVFAPEPFPEDFVIAAGGVLGLRPKAYVTSSSDFTATKAGFHDLAGRYAQDLKTPGAILFAAADAVLPMAEQGVPMGDFGLQCESIAGAGHMIPITRPEACAAFIRRVAAQGQG